MNPAEEPNDLELKELEEIVPARAVLTELARGFLLVHESNPERAVRFAETFLKEIEGRSASFRAEPVPKVSLARLSLARHHHGAVEPRELDPSG